MRNSVTSLPFFTNDLTGISKRSTAGRQSTKHYWADSSRDMLALIEELNEVLDTLKTAGFEVVFYRRIPRCR